MGENDVMRAGGDDGHQSTAPDEAAVLVVDARGTITAWSSKARRLLGRDDDDVIGRPAARLLAAELPETARAGFAERRAWSAPLALRQADGHVVRVTAQALPLLGVARQLEWYVTVTVTVPGSQPAPGEGPAPSPDDDGDPRTALVRIWGLDQLPIPVALFDNRALLVAVNEAMEQLTGRTEQQLFGLPAGEVEHGRVLPGLEELRGITDRVLMTGESVTRDWYLSFPGDLREHAWTGVYSPLKDRTGRMHGFSAVVLDTTEQYQARRRLELVNEASVHIGTALDVARTAEELAETAVGGFADFVTVDLLDAVLSGEDPDFGVAAESQFFRRVAQRSVLEGCPESVVPVGKRHMYDEQSPPGRALALGQAVSHPVDEKTLRWWAVGSPERERSMRAYGIHSTIVVPLRARGTTLGVAVLARHRTAFPYDASDLLLAEELAARAAVCVDNARRYAHERSIALALRRSLLPRAAPRQTAVEIASRYLPAVPGTGVGGDWFDVIPLSGARVALVVGDVVGHGIQASATMGQLRMAVRTLADVDLPPDELLTQLDDIVLRLDRDEQQSGGVPDRDSAGEMSASCLYVVYDPVSGRCSMARAGHPFPAMVAPDGTVDFLDLPAGPPLGLGGIPFETAEFDVPEGSVLALYTDGLIHSAERDIDVGLDLLRATLARPSLTLEERCDAVLRTLLHDRPSDDVALLLARTHILDDAHHASWSLPADPAVVSEARKYAADQLAAWGLDEVAFTTELVVSELVTNAIRYGADPIQMRLIREDGCLTCEVSDGSSTAPHLRRARAFDEGGRGLMLVAQFTDRWGARHTPEGKIIWAEQDLNDQE